MGVDTTEKIALVKGTVDENVEENVLQECMLKQDQSELQNKDVEKEDKAAQDTVVEGVKGVRETGGVFADEEDVDTTEKIALVKGTADENVEENVLQECMSKQDYSELQNEDE